jgi:hypothetical protein
MLSMCCCDYHTAVAQQRPLAPFHRLTLVLELLLVRMLPLLLLLLLQQLLHLRWSLSDRAC